MHSSPGFASMSSATLQYLQSTIDNGKLVTSLDDSLWKGQGFVHLETKSHWSPAFECFLLDEGLPVDLHSPCRVPSRVGIVKVTISEIPAWLNQPGVKFGCVGCFSRIDCHPWISIEKPHKIWPLGFQKVNEPANFLHLFSGGFGGWTQVQKWLSANGLLPEPSTSICVDADFNACSLTNLSFGYQLVTPQDDDFHFGPNLVVNSPVEDPFWLKTLQSGQNLFASMSFPCQPFSLGGRKNGLDTKEGKAVLEAAAMMRMLRPVGIALENVAGFRKHQHASIILRFFRWAGFDLQWEQIQELGSLSSGQRERWLGVLIRHDFHPIGKIGSFSLQKWEKPSWNDDVYNFPLAHEIVKQLKIKDEHKVIYAAKDLLPKGKHHGLIDQPQAVLKARCPKSSDQLATLVANYSSQHLLPPNHIRFTGIFAELCVDGEGDFAFFDPPRWASLLGVLGSLFLPGEIQSAFKVLGNSIATPHAALALLCMCNISGYLEPPIPVVSTIMRMWDARFTSQNSMFIPIGDGWNWALVGPDDFLMLGPIYRHDLIDEADDMYWIFTWPDGSESKIHIPSNSIVQNVLSNLGLPSFLQKHWGIKLELSRVVLLPHMVIVNPPQRAKMIFLPSVPLCRSVVEPIQIEIPASHEVVAIVDTGVEPTLPWTQVPTNEELNVADSEHVEPLPDGCCQTHVLDRWCVGSTLDGGELNDHVASRPSQSGDIDETPVLVPLQIQTLI